MSRHRDVRSMNYSDEYDGYDDVYGHSVEDDYCVSPSAEQFMFDRSKQQNIASFITEPDIVEDNEDIDESAAPSEEKTVLTDIEKAKLVSCMESIKNIIGDSVPESELKDKIIKSGCNTEVALDLILKESSPKNVIEASVANKERVEHYPGPTTTTPQSLSFNIPKFSFKKSENVTENNTMNKSSVNSLDSLKNMAISSSPTSFSSLAGLIASHTTSTSPTVTEVSPEKNSFSSLADLTAYHLQNSSSSTIDANSNGKRFSSSGNFVIPKLSVKKDSSSVSNHTLPSKSSNVNKNSNIGLTLSEFKEKNHSIDSLQKNLSSFLVLAENNGDKKSHNVETKSQNTVPNVTGTRTPSPDSWMIDLSTALKEAESLMSNNSKVNSEVSASACNNIPSLNLCKSTEDIEEPYINLPTTLNLSNLKNIRLPYTKKTVSLFGRTLCKTWKLRKPVIKYQEPQYQTVRRFDFSTPYRRP